MSDDTILKRIFAPENRPNPYPLLAELRRSPVSWQQGGWSEDGGYVVSGYHAVSALLRDPRMTQDIRRVTGEGDETTVPQLSFIELDPPEHDRVRWLAMRHFGPPSRKDYITSLRPKIEKSVADLIDALDGKDEFELVERVSYALPVSVITTVLGVPLEDQPQFQAWLDGLLQSDEGSKEQAQALRDLHDYMVKLVKVRRGDPKDDMISRMSTDNGPDGHLDERWIVATAVLLLIGGHETTANTISNGMLAMLRRPDLLRRVAEEPGYVIGMVEEVLRFEPPVQFLIKRIAVDEIELSGATIPKGANVTLALAAANRDPERFPDPERFDPERADNAHLGFGSGIHFCFGAPLARLETQIALRELARRLVQPQLVQDPPAYRPSAILRGVQVLRVSMSGVQA